METKEIKKAELSIVVDEEGKVNLKIPSDIRMACFMLKVLDNHICGTMSAPQEKPKIITPNFMSGVRNLMRRK